MNIKIHNKKHRSASAVLEARVWTFGTNALHHPQDILQGDKITAFCKENISFWNNSSCWVTFFLVAKVKFFELQVAASGKGFRWCRHKYCSHNLVEGRLCVSKVLWHLIESLILITVDCVFWVELLSIFSPRWDEHEVLSLASHGLAGNTTFYVWGEEVSLLL